jgi:hypothetical protein
VSLGDGVGEGLSVNEGLPVGAVEGSGEGDGDDDGDGDPSPSPAGTGAGVEPADDDPVSSISSMSTRKKRSIS